MSHTTNRYRMNHDTCGALNMLDTYDTSGMRHIYDRWPEIAHESYRCSINTLDLKNIDHVVFAGMGGSGTLGDFFGALLSRTSMHVDIIKGYNLPRTVTPNTLVVCSSISGNTHETLTVMEKAHRADCQVISLSAGGIMQRRSHTLGIPHYVIDRYHSSRASFVSLLYTSLRLLGDISGVSDTHIRESIDELRRVQSRVRSTVISDSNEALSLARWIRQIPLIYYPWGLQAAAIRFKNSIQENTKSHAIIEDVLEASHNSIVAWERDSPVQPILLQGPDDNPLTKARWRIFESYFDARDIPYRTVMAPTGHIITKMIGMIYTLDCTSMYAAILQETDPTPVTSIDFVKERTDKH